MKTIFSNEILSHLEDINESGGEIKDADIEKFLNILGDGPKERRAALGVSAKMCKSIATQYEK